MTKEKGLSCAEEKSEAKRTQGVEEFINRMFEKTGQKGLDSHLQSSFPVLGASMTTRQRVGRWRP